VSLLKGVEKNQQTFRKNNDIKHKSLYSNRKLSPKKIQSKQKLLCITKISSSSSENNWKIAISGTLKSLISAIPGISGFDCKFTTVYENDPKSYRHDLSDWR